MKYWGFWNGPNSTSFLCTYTAPRKNHPTKYNCALKLHTNNKTSGLKKTQRSNQSRKELWRGDRTTGSQSPEGIPCFWETMAGLWSLLLSQGTDPVFEVQDSRDHGWCFGHISGGLAVCTHGPISKENVVTGGFQTSLLLRAFSLILQVEQDMAGPLSFSVEQVFLLRHNCLKCEKAKLPKHTIFWNLTSQKYC